MLAELRRLKATNIVGVEEIRAAGEETLTTATNRIGFPMTKTLSLLLAAILATASLGACRKKTVGEHIDDALDNRPAEKLQDKAEDVGKDLKDAVKDLEKK